MNRAGKGPIRELHGIDLIDLFCKLNFSRVEPGFDQRRDFPGERFREAKKLIDDSGFYMPLTPVARFYPGIKQKAAEIWAAVALETFNEQSRIKDLFHNSGWLLHTPERHEWGPAAYHAEDGMDRETFEGFGEHGGHPYWIFVITPKLVTDPFTGLLDVPRIAWLPEF